jgi:hypothetical protein
MDERITIGAMQQQLVHIQLTQRDHGDLLRQIEKAIGELRRETLAVDGRTISTEEPKQWFSRLRNMSPFWQNVAAGGAVWGFGLSVKSYLDHGGKPLDLIEAVVRLLL